MWRMMIFLLIAAAPRQGAAQEAGSTCVRCHRELEGNLLEPVSLSAQDVHFQKGLSCHDCHGGDPALGIETGDFHDSRSPAKAFIGRPSRRAIASLCATCHSNLNYMRKYNPQARVDQLEEYLTSVHGERNQSGDPNVATCTDCHHAHGIRAVADPNSSVYPINVAETCARCHTDTGLMEPYGIATDQMDLYTKSVHGEALLKQRDISAPTCNDCHGNHGATPPGVDSVANVCGQCHVSQWDLFGQSPHREAFANFDFPACVTCHNHHEVLPTSDAMLGIEEPATCVMCHEPESAGYGAAAEMKALIVSLRGRMDSARQVLERAERAGMEVSGPTYALSEARDRLVRARVEIHKFDTSVVSELVGQGEKIAADAEQSGWKALEDLSFRRKGLAVSAVILLFMMGLLLIKIRQLPR